MSDIRSDFAEYECRQFVSGNKNPGVVSGNAILFTAEKLFILEQNNVLIFEDKLRYINNIKSECEIVPGLYRRSKDFSNDQEGPDDYVGLAAASALIGSSIARDILSYGQTHYFQWGPFKFPYYYNNTSSRQPEAWLGRQPALLAHFYYCAGKKPSVFKKLAWAVSVGLTGLFDKDPKGSGAQDKYILSWLLIEGYKRSQYNSVMCNTAIKLYKHTLKKKWRNGLKEVFAVYFQNPDHPISRYFNE